MEMERNRPVVVGVAEAVRRPEDGLGPEDLPDPGRWSAEVLRAAAEEAGAEAELLARAGLVATTPSIAWPAGNAATMVADELGAEKARTMRSGFQGGNGPQLLVNEAAARIQAGQIEVALIGGAEAVQTGRYAASEGIALDWREADFGAPCDEVLDVERPANTDAEVAVGVIAPIMAYPLIENAIWAASGESADEHLGRIAGLWSRFSEVASRHPIAWTPSAHTPEDVREISEENRLVTHPYRKLMNANIQVDQAAGLVICAEHVADELGIAADRRIYPQAGAQAADEWFLSEREALERSPAIRECGKALFEHAGVGADDVSVIDLYSCFPSAVQLAAAELGLPLDDPARPLTQTGGLTFFGGPGNNYSMHGIAGVVRGLRNAGPGAFGLASALGWYATKHAIGLYGTEPPARGYGHYDVQSTVDSAAARREVADPYDGAATAETCTVIYERDGSPSYGILFALTADGRRALGRTTDAATAEAMTADGFLGSEVTVRSDRNFTIG